MIISPGKTDALVKLDVLQLDALALPATGALKQDLVVEAEAQLGHARQVDAHLDAADDLAAENVAVGVGHQVHRLDDVEKDLVLAVANALGAPRHGVRDCHGRARLDFELVAFLRDVPGKRTSIRTISAAVEQLLRSVRKKIRSLCYKFVVRK